MSGFKRSIASMYWSASRKLKPTEVQIDIDLLVL